MKKSTSMLCALCAVVFALAFSGCKQASGGENPPATYVVTYDGNGNTGGAVPADQTKTQGTGVVLADRGDLAKSGYVFEGWNTRANGSGTDYAEGAWYTGDASVTLHAKWTKLCVIGEIGPAGGYIFYDKGYSSEGWRYLEAAPADLTGMYEWGAYGKGVSGTGTRVGTGKANTGIIVNYLQNIGETGKAAQAAAACSFNGYSGWFLPSKDELNLMYQNLKVNGKGGFSNVLYWSSSQIGTDFAWYQDFDYGGQYGYGNYNASYVRVVRAF